MSLLADEKGQWREALDPSTGSTYYYHRQTRETTWIRPACLDAPSQTSAATTVTAATTFKFRSEPEVDEREEHSRDGEEGNEGEYVFYMLSQCATISAESVLAEEPDLVDKLVGITLSCGDVDIRRASLRCLLMLSIGKSAPRLGFHSNQSWVTLSEFVRRWADSGDYESCIVYCCMISLLVGGAARGVIGNDTFTVLTRWMKSQVEKNVLLIDMESEFDKQQAQSISFSDGRILQALSKCSAGQSLPGLTLVLLAKQAFLTENAAVKFIRVGGLAALQSLCINGWVPSDVSSAARLLIEHAMSSSSYVRGNLLTSFLSLSKAVASIALPSGADPLCISSGFSEHGGSADESDEEADEALESWRESSLPLQRDVDWKPKYGTSWYVSSVVLWTQCPELRGTIEGLWEETGGELELGTNTSEAALASAVKFLHTGILFPPPTHESRIDLLKLACELGAESLVKQAADAILNQLTLKDVDSALSISRSLGLVEFEKGVHSFRQTGQRPLISFISGSMELRQAVSSSVLEVNETLLELGTKKSPANVRPSKRTPVSGNSKGGGGAFHSSDGVESSFSSDVNVFQTNYPDPNFRGTPSSKIKSGGIYGLLLEATAQPQQTKSKKNGSRAGSMMATQQTQPHGSLGSNKRVPGKLPGDPKSRSAFGGTANRQPKSAPAAATDRNKSAKPDSSNHPPKKNEDRSFEAGAWMEGESGIFEFDTRMSLAPEREPSKREKRLSALANPKHISPTKSDADLEVVDIDGTNASPKRAQSPKLSRDRAGRDSSPAACSPSSSLAAFESDRGSRAEPLVALNPNVRSSLVLLKSRSLRRRRSIADVENDTDPPMEEEEEEVRQTQEDSPLVKFSAPAARRSLLSCTKKQGCSCQDCLSSASIAIPLSPREASSFKIRNSYEVVDNTSSSQYDQLAFDGADETNVGEFDDNIEDGEDCGDTPSFKPEPVHTLQAWKSKPPVYNNPQLNDSVVEGSFDVELQGCPDCDRKFRPEALARHVGICKKVFLQKRKVFDSKRKRLTDNPELLQSKQSSSTMERSARQFAAAAGGTAKWRQDSEAFREAMKGAREYSSAIASGAPPPVIASRPDPSYIQCPHCSRRFNQTAGERHIPVCNSKSRPQALKR